MWIGYFVCLVGLGETRLSNSQRIVLVISSLFIPIAASVISCRIVIVSNSLQVINLLVQPQVNVNQMPNTKIKETKTG